MACALAAVCSEPEVISVQRVLPGYLEGAWLDHLLPSRSIMLTRTIDRQPESQMWLQGVSPIIRRIQGEFNEMPGLKLTEAQARRLWGLDGNTCRLVLWTLLERRFLRRTESGMYMRAW